MKKEIFILLFLFSCSDLPPTNNFAPEIVSVISTETLIATDTSITVECIATDQDHNELSYNWNADNGTFIGSGNKVSWYPPQLSGVFNIICEVSDPLGGTDKSNIFINVTRFDTLEIEFSNVFFNMDSRKFNKGFFYFTSDQEWRDFQILSGIDETELIPAPVDFSNHTLISIFYGTTSGCGSFNEIIAKVERYKGELFVYQGPWNAGACWAEIDPYQIISVKVTDVSAEFIP